MDRCVSCPITDDEEGKKHHHAPLRYTRSLNSSPRPNLRDGIPLGSLTARVASRSFWNPDMLKRSMDEIVQCAAKEVSCLGSSVESLHNSEGEFSDQDIQISEEEERAGLSTTKFTIGDQHEDRELRNPLVKSSSGCRGYATPPYLSPGVTRRLQESWSLTIFRWQFFSLLHKHTFLTLFNFYQFFADH